MTDISPARRRELKALAHHLDPVVLVSEKGLSESVLKEIDTALRAHELIKIRVFGDDREVRKQYLEAICAHTGACPVQSIGKLLVIWRERPAAEAPAPRRPRLHKPPALTKRAAQTVLEGGGLPKAKQKRSAPQAPADKAKAGPRNAPGGDKARGKR